ncbi:MAG: LanC-like protein [Micropepsaceae bacterium]
MSADGLWPAHPSDADPQNAGPFTDLYFGAAGVIWALDHLERAGAAAPGAPLHPHLDGILARNRRETGDASWLGGSTGILFTHHKLAPHPARAADLAAAILGNAGDPSLEIMCGSPGSMLAALALYRQTGDGAAADLFRTGAEALIARLAAHDDIGGAPVWTQMLYGRPARYLGAVHGFAGNVFVLNAGRDLLDAAAWAALAPRLAHTVEATAVRSGGEVNWPSHVGPLRPEAAHLVQHCHGAPGMVTALAACDAIDDALLTGAGDLIWRAGPLAKGAGLCHGTAGNGYAFLALFRRTGDEILARPRPRLRHARPWAKRGRR